jgi:uncharacterized iron-regulated membrane protein
MFNGHLWLGVIVSAFLIVICITGILLNHKRGLGLMPDVPHSATGEFTEALPMAELVRLAGLAAPDAAASMCARVPAS